MQTITFGKLWFCLSFFVVPVLLFAQEGHPLKGSWLGVWHENAANAENLLVVLDWNSQQITGIINPGTENIAITRADLDPEAWTVRIEADGIASTSSEHVHYVIEGKLEQLEMPHRSIKGTWNNGSESGDFELVRQ